MTDKMYSYNKHVLCKNFENIILIIIKKIIQSATRKNLVKIFVQRFYICIYETNVDANNTDICRL